MDHWAQLSNTARAKWPLGYGQQIVAYKLAFSQLIRQQYSRAFLKTQGHVAVGRGKVSLSPPPPPPPPRCLNYLPLGLSPWCRKPAQGVCYTCTCC